MSKAPMMTLGLAHQLLPGSTLVGDASTPLTRVHTDTRTMQPGDFFVALRGERFDAHDHLAQAREAGAVAALAERGLGEAGLAGLLVPDTRVALGELAAAWRLRFDIPVVAITGSNGKTTVTQMVASILRAWMAEQGTPEAALSTQGNFNNEIGVPLTLLRLRERLHRCAVVELGMNHPGEIALLARMAAPTVALVNNAQREHQEFMHTVEAVARENGSVMAHLAGNGVAVFPADDVDHTPIWRELAAQHRVVDFSDTSKAAVTGQAQWVVAQAAVGPHWAIALQSPLGSAQVNLRMAGQHNVRNALAACAAAVGAGVSLSAIVAGLQAFEPVKGRSAMRVLTRHGRTITLIDDSYNANPDSVRAAIDMLAALPGPRWLLLGDMGEVGTQGPAFHEEVGQYARDKGLEHVWTAGDLCQHTAKAYGPGARAFNVAADIAATITASPEGEPVAASILVKGSRFMKMEQIVAVLAGGSHAA
jgi:UDP-N-acetylmuramoyl-tripeptide--D-alanyl-D-alanine ligase